MSHTSELWNMQPIKPSYSSSSNYSIKTPSKSHSFHAKIQIVDAVFFLFEMVYSPWNVRNRILMNVKNNSMSAHCLTTHHTLVDINLVFPTAMLGHLQKNIRFYSNELQSVVCFKIFTNWLPILIYFAWK